jgi:hypothetical protein
MHRRGRVDSRVRGVRQEPVLALGRGDHPRGVNAIAQLLMIPAYPFWSLSIFTLDSLAIFGLLVDGARISSAS